MTGQELMARRWVMDGAMATRLFTKGAAPDRAVEDLNLTLAPLVRDVHREYLAAGAQMLRTNTFGANRLRSAKFAAMNRAAVRIAREVAKEQAPVAGAIGPAGARMAPLGRLSEEEAREIFREHAAALAGVDLFVLETFRDLAELRAAVDGVRAAAGEGIAVIAQLSVEDDGRLQDGTPPERYGPAMNALAADVIGINCSSGPYAVWRALQRIAAVTDKPLSAVPGAGFPAPMQAAYVAEYGRRFLDCGAAVIGACCGSTPEHIEKLVEAVAGYEPEAAARTLVHFVDLEPMEELPKPELGAEFTVVASRGRSAAQLQRELLDLHARGARRILCVAGRGVGLLDVDVSGLVHIARGLNRGLDFGGNAAGTQTQFLIGTLAESGMDADFSVTQPLFEAASLTPNQIGLVWPLRDAAEADYAMHELGIAIPEAARERIAAGEGAALAEEIAGALRRAGSVTLVSQWPLT